MAEEPKRILKSGFVCIGQCKAGKEITVHATADDCIMSCCYDECHGVAEATIVVGKVVREPQPLVVSEEMAERLEAPNAAAAAV